MHFCNGAFAKRLFSFCRNPLFTLRHRGRAREQENRKDSQMERVTQTLATVINVLFVAGVFGVMTIALGSTFA